MKLKHIGLLVIGLILAILYFFIYPNSTFFPECPLYSTTGIYCPGCGNQRALHDFLHLDIMGVLGHNILFMFGVFILAYQLIIIVFNKFSDKKVNNLLYHKKTPIIILIIVKKITSFFRT